MFSIIKCHRCDRVFVHFGDKKTLHCTNHQCHTMITRSKLTEYPISFPSHQPYDCPVQERAGKAYIYVTAFNNVISLTAAVFSTDGQYALFIPVCGEKLTVTNVDLLNCIPASKRNVLDTKAITCQSGVYAVTEAVQVKIR